MSSTEGEQEPRVGTLAWLQTQDVIERSGVCVPACHRIPEDATIAPADGDTRCRVVSASGERCKGTRLLAYGLCMGHAGGGGTSLDAMRAKSAAKQRSLKVTRQILAIGPRRSLDPRAVARLRAAQRADELAQAVVDGPLDDRKLSSVERQRAALSALDATFPLVSTTVSLTIDDPEQMSWNDMEAAALSLES